MSVARVLARWWPALGLLALWQAWVSFAHVTAIVAPAPRAVLAAFGADPARYLGAAAATLETAAAGLVLGTLIAFALALAAALARPLALVLSVPPLVAQATPVVALLPVLARLLGYDRRSVIAAVALVTLFPTFALLAGGLRALPSGSADLFALLGASPLARLRLLALPSAVPNLLLALRLAAANVILAALVAEFLMGTTGLGRLFSEEESALHIAGAWAAGLVATCLSVALYLAARRVERAGRAWYSGVASPNESE